MKVYINTLLTCTITLGILGACSTGTSDQEAQKLVEKQEQLIEKSQEDINDFFGEISTIKDSMELAQNQIAEKRKLTQKEINRLEKNKAQFALNRYKELRDSLAADMDETVTMEKEIFSQIERLEGLEDSLSNTNKVLSGVAEKNKKNFETDISEVDKKISTIEAEQQAARRAIDLSQKRMDMAERKIQLLKDEIVLLEDEKTHLLRTNAAQVKITSVEDEIAELQKQISSAQSKMNGAQEIIDKNEKRAADLEQQRKALEEDIRSQDQNKGVITQYIESEKKRTEERTSEIEEKSSKLKEKASETKASKELIQMKLETLDTLIYAIENEKIPNIQDRIRQLENAGLIDRPAYQDKIDSLDKAIAESSKSYSQESDKLTKTQSELKEEAEESAKNTRRTIWVLLGIALVVVVVFYVLGKRRKAQSNKK